MYTHHNFRTKKALKAAVEARMQWERDKPLNGRIPPRVTYFQPAGIGDIPLNGKIHVEGPNYQPHTWYAQCEVRDGQIVKVK